MPKFTISFQRYIEQTADYQIEAATPEEALAQAHALDKECQLDLVWMDGDDAKEFQPNSIRDEKGDDALGSLTLAIEIWEEL